MALKGASKYLIFWVFKGKKLVKAKKEKKRKRKRRRREEKKERNKAKVWILVWISMIFGMDLTWKARIL